jgi:hypothetical protein
MMPNAAVPASYVAGTINLPANIVFNLLELIQQQVNRNCPGSATEFVIAADPLNTGSVIVGAASPISGPLSATNYSFKLAPTSPPRVYRSTYPGNSTPLGELQVMALNPATIHIEVQA